jgi:hypothetical protein
MPTMQERLAEVRRRLTLDMMKEADGRLSDSSIRAILGRIHSESTDIDQVRSDMAFFERHGLVSIEKLPHGPRDLWVATFTAAGQAVARGRNHVGIAERDAV